MDEKNLNEFESEENFSFTYKINPEDTGFALSRYFKNYVYKRNIAYTIVFLIIMGFYVFEIIRQPQSVICWALCAVCAALVLWLWLKLATFKKRTVSAAVATKDDVYECKVFDDYLKIKIVKMAQSEEIGERVDDPTATKINFKSDVTLVENYENIFLLFVNKEMTFIFPKLDENVGAKLDEFFKNNCGENYVSLPATDKGI